MSRFVLALVFTLGGCASIPPIDAYRVRFTSEPPDATVTVAGRSCVTPCVLRLPPGNHPAQVVLNSEQAQAVLVSASDKPGLKQNVQAAVGSTLQTTGTVLDAVGEATIQVFINTARPVNDDTAVVFLAFGAIGITGKLAGQLLIKVGDGMLGQAADPEPNTVHVVFKDGRWSGQEQKQSGGTMESDQDGVKTKAREDK